MEPGQLSLRQVSPEIVKHRCRGAFVVEHGHFLGSFDNPVGLTSLLPQTLPFWPRRRFSWSCGDSRTFSPTPPRRSIRRKLGTFRPTAGSWRRRSCCESHKRHESAFETFNHLVNRLLKGQVGYGNNGSIDGQPDRSKLHDRRRLLREHSVAFPRRVKALIAIDDGRNKLLHKDPAGPRRAFRGENDSKLMAGPGSSTLNLSLGVEACQSKVDSLDESACQTPGAFQLVCHEFTCSGQ